MTPNPYSEDHLVEQPALALLCELGWDTACGLEETFAPEGGSLGRRDRREVVLLPRLRAALERLNPDQPPDAISAAIEELSRNRSAMGLVAANREVYRLLKDGVLVSVPDRERGGQSKVRLRVVDWDRPAENDWLAVNQFNIKGDLYSCIPDLVGFVNGLPLVVIEFKNPGISARVAFDDNLTHYKAAIPQLFWSNAFLIASNGTASRIGSLSADWERFFEWKRIEREDEKPRVSLEVMLRGTCQPQRMLDYVENFILFSDSKGGLVKIIAQNHQFLGVNNAIAATLEARRRGHGRAGVFWQTQGSGKSYSMAFYSQKIQRKHPGDWSFVIVTDRTDLDEQIADTFKAAGVVSEAEGNQCHASSGDQLAQLLRGNHRYVFTLIQKFRIPELLCDRTDVVVITDEAHRSQYDTLALNMRTALPKALFTAFTGTPLIDGEERTREVFGDYVSIYDFQQAVEDGATVPLFYENRTPELQLVNPDLNDDIYAVIEAADLDGEQEQKLERELGRQYHIITRDDRLETIARDIVHHFLGRGFMGKAIAISIDKATTLRMYDKVQRYWRAETERVRVLVEQLPSEPTEAGEELRERLQILTSTEMAVIVSPGQNEIADMKALGLDIEPHRRLLNASEPPLDQRFKKPSDPLRLVFVCAMWLTGFDAPSCSTLYLDKPMRNHTLMQTIARANRVFPGKHSGLIVDYANVFASLEKALALYGSRSDGGTRPTQNKSVLVDQLRQVLNDALGFCAEHGVDIAAMGAMPPASMGRLQAIADAREALIAPEDLRKRFQEQQRLVQLLYAAIKPDPAALEFAVSVGALNTIAASIREKLNPPANISAVMGQIGQVLDQSITGIAIRDQGPPSIDLSKIDFQALADKFKQKRNKKTELEELKALIAAHLSKMIQINPTRSDFREQFEALIASYNAGSRSVEEIYKQLLQLSIQLSHEQQRHIRENLSEEELAMFDILLQSAPDLNDSDRAKVKQSARELVERIKHLLVLNWKQKAASRAQLRLLIEDALDIGLPRAYTPALYQQKCEAVFAHIEQAYPERDRTIYAEL
ncbi:MAG: type I restriction endonuclease subunit R [Synechococcus sp.]